MGQTVSCSGDYDVLIFDPVQYGETDLFRSLMKAHPTRWKIATPFSRNSLLHIAAANGQIQIMSILLEEWFMNPNLFNSHRQTPLMLAVKRGRLSCTQFLIQKRANILMLDSPHGRTSLHYAAYFGHSDCLQAILSAAASSNDISVSWGFSRFVNAKDVKGETPLHLASRKRHPNCVHILLDNGALVSTSTGRHGLPGSTPLHLAAKGGSVDCIRELLAWGADRLQKDELGRVPYVVALEYRHGACAALLNPSSAEPLVWPSPLKFISQLKQDAKILLERALIEANKEREKSCCYKSNKSDLPAPSQHSSSIEGNDDSKVGDENEMCCICFEKECTLEVQDCGHQMCAQCTVILCCHSKPDPPTTLRPKAPVPVCPFCRSDISRLVVAKTRPKDKSEQLNNTNVSETSSSSPIRKLRKAWNSTSIGPRH